MPLLMISDLLRAETSPISSYRSALAASNRWQTWLLPLNSRIQWSIFFDRSVGASKPNCPALWRPKYYFVYMRSEWPSDSSLPVFVPLRSRRPFLLFADVGPAAPAPPAAAAAACCSAQQTTDSASCRRPDAVFVYVLYDIRQLALSAADSFSNTRIGKHS